jgi:hypothetical protein
VLLKSSAQYSAELKGDFCLKLCGSFFQSYREFN